MLFSGSDCSVVLCCLVVQTVVLCCVVQRLRVQCYAVLCSGLKGFKMVKHVVLSSVLHWFRVYCLAVLFSGSECSVVLCCPVVQSVVLCSGVQ